MSKVFKVILSLSLLILTQTHVAAGRFIQFFKAPSIALGVTGSIGSYTYQSDAVKENFTKEKNLALEQTSNPELETKKAELKHFCEKQRGVHVDYMTFNSMDIENPLIEGIKISGAAAQMHNGESLILLGDEFKSDNSNTPQELKDFLIGHECTHLEKEDLKKRCATRALIPLSVTTAWRCARFGGRGKIVGSLAGLIGLLTSTKITNSYIHFQEFRADEKASEDPNTLEAGAQFFEKIYNEQVAQQKAINTYGSEEEKIHYAGVMGVMKAMHPCPLERAQRLRKQATKIRTEEK